jgi:tetratricopeptide (TPR) repeat protein
MVQKHIKHKQILKTLKRDELREGLDRAVAFAKANTENLLISVIIVVVLIILVPMYFKHQAENEMRASNQLDRAISVSMQPVQGENAGAGQPGFKTLDEKYRKTLEAYQEVSTTYHNTKVAILARLGEADCWFYLKDYTKAEAICQEELGKHTQDYYTPQLKARLAACQENTLKWGDAARTYQEILSQFPAYYDLQGVRLGLARCESKLGKLEDAKKILLQVQSADPSGFWSEAARQQLSLLNQGAVSPEP